jgi:hypothetical protein
MEAQESEQGGVLGRGKEVREDGVIERTHLSAPSFQEICKITTLFGEGEENVPQLLLRELTLADDII